MSETEEKQFPILFGHRGREPGEELCPDSIPWCLVAPFSKQASLNHGQSLERLAERGGLCPRELYALIHGTSYYDIASVTDETVVGFIRELSSGDGEG